MLRSEPQKIARVLHDLYVMLPVIKEHGSQQSIEKHLLIIEYYKSKHDEAVARWSFPDKAA